MAALYGVGVNVSSKPDVLFSPVAHGFVAAFVLFPDANVRRVLIGDDACLPIYFFPNCALECASRNVRYDSTVQPSASFDGTEHSHFVASASRSADSLIARLAADVGFVTFNCSG